jgi:hypothetical protein
MYLLISKLKRCILIELRSLDFSEKLGLLKVKLARDVIAFECVMMWLTVNF